MFTKEQMAELKFDEIKEVLAMKAKFHAKKAKATAEMKRIPKNGFNSFHNYAYARESDVKDHVREILRENQLSITSDLVNRSEIMVKTKQGESTKTDVEMEFQITDTETGYFELYRLDGVAIDNGDKGSYKAYTNTIKYFLMNEFLIPTGDDVEADAPELQPTKDQPEQPQKPQNRQQNNQQNRSGNKPPMETWKHIMNMEDRLVDISGKTKQDVRNALEHEYGRLPKYKEMDEDKAQAILKTLKEWATKYEPPADYRGPGQ